MEVSSSVTKQPPPAEYRLDIFLDGVAARALMASTVPQILRSSSTTAHLEHREKMGRNSLCQSATMSL